MCVPVSRNDVIVLQRSLPRRPELLAYAAEERIAFRQINWSRSALTHKRCGVPVGSCWDRTLLTALMAGGFYGFPIFTRPGKHILIIA